MKTKLIFLNICVVIFGLTTSANTNEEEQLTGNSLTEFGNYTIEKSDAPMVIDNSTIETYDLVYEKAKNPIRVGLVKEENCTTYIVRADEFEVEYKCNNGVFGVKKIDERFQELPAEANNVKMNRVEYLSQRVICQDDKSKDELLGLIACYFPDLISDQHLAKF